MSLPIVLALAGTAFIAIAIFSPFHTPAVSRQETPLLPNDAHPHWPELVEPTASGCDAAARLDLVDALVTIGSPWAIDVLRTANAEESDARVLAAIAAALAAEWERAEVPA